MLCLTLSNYFPQTNIYTEQVPEGFQRPAFFVWQEKQQQEKMIGNRYYRLYKMVVSYFPPDPCADDVYEELWAVGDDLTDLLQLLEVDGDFWHGRDMSMEIKDGLLEFAVGYGVYLCLAESGSKMNKINVNGVID
jgi:hypothetical protein